MHWLDGFKMAAFPFFSFCSALIAVSLGIFLQFNAKQPRPYMDEIFHIPQAQKYCQYKFKEWDPKITTLPGMYLLSFLGLRTLSFFFGQELDLLCSAFFLRITNVVFLMGNMWLLRKLLIRLHCSFEDKKTQQSNKVEAVKEDGQQESLVTKCSITALILVIFPVLYFFTFLYYTDSSSVFFVLLMYYLSLHGNHFAAALIGSMSVVIRQTNVIWVVFTAGVTTLHTLQRNLEKPSGNNSSSLLTELKVYCVAFYQHFSKCLKCLWAYGLVVLAFGAFVVWNRGIVIGDRTQHKACLNFPQAFYLLLFTLTFSSSLLLLPEDILSYLKSLRNAVAKPLYIIGLVLAMVGMVFLVYRFTYIHEYLLADNRHFPFYIWRRIYSRHWLAKYVLVPVYMFAAFCIHSKLSVKRDRMWILMLYICVGMVTIPQKLLEFRYFIIPYLLFRLHVPLVSYVRLLMECILYVSVNGITIYLFLEKPFQWAHSPQEVQRFMW